MPILLHPHPLLRRRARELPAITEALRALAENMRETMLGQAGVGLAAPQVGESLRLIVADTSPNRNLPIALVNPVVAASSRETAAAEEGCLSVPGVREVVHRPARVTVRGLNLQGEKTEMECEGMLSVCMQHEIDHLDGVLFIDRLSRLKRERVLAKYKKMQTRESTE